MAVKLWTAQQQTLVFSVYVPYMDFNQSHEEASIQPMLKEIETCIRQATETTTKLTTIIMAGDFNRHHPIWCKDRVHHGAIELAEELVNFFQKHGLQSCLPRGTPTYWSMSHPGSHSTIDLTVTDTPGKLVKCHLYHDHYGSDHRATYSKWSLQPARNTDRKPRKAYERADWRRIGESVQARTSQLTPIQTKPELDDAVAQVISSTCSVVDSYTPTAKPSPYSKRWFTPELKIQQCEVNRVRRKWQTSCAERGWHDEATPEDEAHTEQREEIPWVPITEEEVHRALQAAKPMKHPEKMWKRAKIIVLRKPGKPNDTIPGAYRPISLLNTLGKILEAVIARRLSYYAEVHGLLPNTQFGGRPGRNTEQALLVLRNAIDRAWLSSKVVTLVAFDLKGAFNGVNRNTLDLQLKATGIPTKLRAWVASFMQNRSASTSFDDFESPMSALENAGLAQGSPLSPILFIFFNSNLVNQPVDFHGGASAFIDDYFRWRAGKSAEENLKKLQDEDIPRIEQWAQQTGSSVAAEKTELIHFTRKKDEQTRGQLAMQGATIKPSATAKLLGVVWDRELRWKEHVQQAVKRAIKTNIALAGLRHLRLGQMRQVYQACVTPIMDYASTVWHNPLKDKRHLKWLDTVQRSALIRILSAFRTIATATMEVETYVLPTHLRLKQGVQEVIVKLCTPPS
ncbi:hypothetical protein CBS147353_11800 [Aspergillus niger]|nr:hypothetical protein CBS147353_11800 [Aspergillus niger]